MIKIHINGITHSTSLISDWFSKIDTRCELVPIGLVMVDLLKLTGIIFKFDIFILSKFLNSIYFKCE